jgi:DNA-binding transcriptional LysR family regulator
MTTDLLDNRHSDEISAFLAVAGQGSFVAAGRQLERHPTVVSKRLAAMENAWGSDLLSGLLDKYD